MNLKKLEGQPMPEELIDTLGEADLTVAYLTAKLTPEQDARIKARLIQMYRARQTA